jgi:hypothetical protein
VKKIISIGICRLVEIEHCENKDGPRLRVAMLLLKNLHDLINWLEFEWRIA